MKLPLSLLVFLFFALISCHGQSLKNVQTMQPIAFAKAINETSNPQLLDVRTAEEFASDHLPSLSLYENKQLKWQNSGYISETDLKKQL